MAEAKPGRHPCPKCGDDLERVRRRAGDRLSSVWRPVHRYQCRNPLCYWSGTLYAGPHREWAKLVLRTLARKTGGAE
jgi:hypothetical protein